ncbi:MAG TPA: NADH-quinone oxidoreductase subunit J [Cytophagaceae bacterium]|jgi:NADH-quinone oxidoreductase subunit J|nr:NADH-quinone oxidoreductase subunit J [Cytophagaceae bacterium]
MDKILFLSLAVVAIFSALAVIFAKSPVYSVLSLIVTFFSVAGHFVLLNAQFLAIVNIIVYAGAIMVLFLFVIMLLNLNKSSEPQKPFYVKLAACVAGGLLLVTLVGAVKGASVQNSDPLIGTNIGSVEKLGEVLFSNFLVPFEISSVLFLSAMIGAVMLGKKNLKDS